MAALAAILYFTAIVSCVAAKAPQSPVITPAPRYPPPAQFEHRSVGGLDTCGYVSGNSQSPLTCPASFTCANIGSDNQYLGCCNQVNCATSSGAAYCGDREDGHCQGPDDGVDSYDICTSVYGSVLLCTDQTAPACATYLRIPPSDGAITRSSFSCAASRTSILFLYSTTNTDEALPTSAAASTDGFAGLFPSSTSQGRPASTTPTSPSNPSSNNSNSSNKPLLSQGAIIAIAIGGAVVLILVAFLFRYLFRNCCSGRGSHRPDDGSSAWAASQWQGSQYGGPQKPGVEAWVMGSRNQGGAYSDYGDGNGMGGGYGGGGGWRG